MALPKPNTRKEQYLNAAATGQSEDLPDPITREEQYLKAIAENGGGGGGSGEVTGVKGNAESTYRKGNVNLTAGNIGAYTKNEVNTALADKVDKAAGKGLSTNDYDDTAKGIVDGVSEALEGKQDVLTAGDNITIEEDPETGETVISATGGGGTGAVSGVKGSEEQNYRTGNVSISAANVGAYTQAQTDNLLDEKVDKNGTDRLMTAAEGTKLGGLADVKSIGSGLALNALTGELTATGIEVEIDDAIDPQSANPVQNAVIAAALDDKADASDLAEVATSGDYDDLSNKPAIPDSTSDLTNDSGFITNTVNNLVNYYLKSETYSASEVDTIVAAIKNSRFEVVSVLPTTDIKTNVIYLVPKSTAQTDNAKDEYINLDGTTAGWEKIGDTEVDLSGYVTTTALNTALADYTTTANLTTLLAAKADATDLAAILDGTNIDSFGDVETALSDKVDKVSGKGLSANDYTNADKAIVDGVTSALAGKQDTISDLATIRSGAAAGATAVQPSATSGLLKNDGTVDTTQYVSDISGKQDTISDLATIRSGAAAGATAYQKPASGIPSTDLSSAVQTSLGKADTALQDLGVKVSGTVSDDTLTFTNAAITANSIIDGPYIADVLVGLVEAEQTGTTVTFTLTDDSADGKNAYIWVRE